MVYANIVGPRNEHKDQFDLEFLLEISLALVIDLTA